jgi:hypothetical protein
MTDENDMLQDVSAEIQNEYLPNILSLIKTGYIGIILASPTWMPSLMLARFFFFDEDTIFYGIFSANLRTRYYFRLDTDLYKIIT